MNTKQISVLFNSLGIPPNHKGYPYLVYLIGLSADSYGFQVPLMKDLYAKTGEHFNVSAEIVANNIRTVLRKYWNQKNSSTFYQVTRYNGEGSLPIKEFVSVLAEYLANHC